MYKQPANLGNFVKTTKARNFLHITKMRNILFAIKFSGEEFKEFLYLNYSCIFTSSKCFIMNEVSYDTPVAHVIEISFEGLLCQSDLEGLEEVTGSWGW